MPHPTWTHGVLIHRVVSYAVFGRAPQERFPAMNGHDIRQAARAELDGYGA
ncbi:hypothetical protein BC793_15124 [Actinoplanes xinjiangensis]|uniref:Uncharacterized protein n=1 Tax=Actinoplanes xinjiangensis TaxID=512350 RepID=A0A316EH12_9ACTN|nr:hypothetical protein BC793_15124 [Actinoplanes xinjiangensis]GIF45208.1 hypothetical protein Axi01nite_95190 [Actinoplanes xinjiangensis]